MAEHPSIPPGPARMRAGDAERERVAVAIREHWHAGRLTDEELEQRLGRVFASRTLGDLRTLVSDLPVPPAPPRSSSAHARAYVSRALVGWLKKLVVLAASVFAVLVVIGLAVGDDEEAERVDRVDRTPPRRADRGPDLGPLPAQPKVTRVREGRTGVDDGLAFRVLRVRPEETVPLRSDRGGGELAPGEGRKYLVADVRFENRTKAPADPFCGSGGAQLRTRDGRGHEIIGDLYKLEGNQVMCSGGLSPGDTTEVKLVFSVPPSARARDLEIWNSDAEANDDILGARTRLRFEV